MKKALIFFSICLLFSQSIKAQTASNFSCNDCSGNFHDAFADLDAGKVLVLVWVMPCSNCINGALTAQTEVQTANANNPGKVLYYLIDDYANTTCATLNGWANSNAITAAIVMSNSLASMSAYGAAGMPKIVVLGGKNHTVFYNKNAPDFTAIGIRDAIQAALAAAPNAIAEVSKQSFSFRVYPNPCNNFIHLSFSNAASPNTHVQIVNALGECVIDQNMSNDNDLQINIEKLANGIYNIYCTNEEQNSRQKILLFH